MNIKNILYNNIIKQKIKNINIKNVLKQNKKNFLFYLLNISLIFLIIFFSFLGYISVWITNKFGGVSLDGLFFHLSMPLKNVPTDWSTGIFAPIFATIFTGIFFYFLNIVFNKYKSRNNVLLLYFLVFIIVSDYYYMNKNFHINDFFASKNKYSSFIEKHYVYPNSKNIIFPKNKKNLIILMIESMETSYQDKKNGGFFDKNYISELTDIANENISFSHSDKIEGAMVPPESGWTIAATVVQTAGIPLKLYGSNYIDDERYIDNKMNMYKYFLPGAKTLGDILFENGYHNYFFLGTAAEYAGKKDYLKQHGHYKIIDKYEINSIKNRDKKTRVYDEEVFEIVKEQLTKISKNQQPFSLLIQTFDTHFGNINSFQTVSLQTENFYNWLKKQNFFKDTVILIVGDHCNMNQIDFVNVETKNFRYVGNIQRKVYNVFINSQTAPIKTTYRKFSTLDMFPTILSALGVEINGNKLGLGTNLFSNEKTLLELYSPEYTFNELQKRSIWYDKNLLYKK